MQRRYPHHVRSGARLRDHRRQDQEITAFGTALTPATTSSSSSSARATALLISATWDQPRGRDVLRGLRIPAGIYGTRSAPSSARVTRSPAAPTSARDHQRHRALDRDRRPTRPGATSANPTSTPPQGRRWRHSVDCWRHTPCSDRYRAFVNPAATAPWDALADGTPTFTTVGNNASTHEAWLSPLTPGGLAQAPYSPKRRYTTTFTDAWNNSQCDPTQLVPGGNDIDASVTNLFVSHNRMHDYSYYMGYTEKNYNIQIDNLGRGGVER